MRFTKENQWFGFFLSAIVVSFLIAAFVANQYFETYRFRLAYESEKSTVPSNAASFEESVALCDQLHGSDRVHCFDEAKHRHRAETRAQNNLLVQQDMAAWALGVLLTGLFGLALSAGGVAALVWTFRETRKMTQAQDRAYLLLGRGRLNLDPTYGLSYQLEVSNSGNTPASFIEASLVLTITGRDSANKTKALVRSFKLSGVTNELPAKAAGILSTGRIGDILELPAGLLVSGGSHYRKTGTNIGTGDPDEDGVDDSINVQGVVKYFDVFSGEHILTVAQYSLSLEDDQWMLRNQEGFL